MKKTILNFSAFFLAGITCIAQNFDKASVISDLEYLRESLEQTHYDLFAFTSEEEFDANYEKVKATVTGDSISLKQAISLFQSVISKANTGHAEIDFPIPSYLAYADGSGTIFPLELAFENGKALIRKNHSDKELEIGAEVIAVNGMEIEAILRKMYPYISAETLYFKLAKIEFWTFPRMFWQVFGEKKSFKVSIRDAEGTKDVVLNSVPVWEGYEMKRKDFMGPRLQLDYIEDIAYLSIGSFGSDEENFKKYIDSSFADIKAKNADRLILDLRNNNGGDNSQSDHLVSYFADKPFVWNSSFKLRSSAILKDQTRKNSDTTNPYFRRILDSKVGEVYEDKSDPVEPRALSKRFMGEVFVLVNRQSYSMSAVTAAMIQDYGFGTIVGEETGDHPTLHASQFAYTLPKTGVVVKVPKGFMVRPGGGLERRGVVPDIAIKDHLLDEEDEILKELLDRLQK